MIPDDQAKCKEGSGYSLIREKIKTDLDPELQNLILGALSGEKVDDRVDVLARLKNAEDAVPPELQVGQRIGDVVTGTLSLNDIVQVREHPNVVSLKNSRLLHESLDHSVPEVGASRHQLRSVFRGSVIDGRGVIVGVIDQGCDFAHPNFQNEKGTRILNLWDQRKASPNHPPPHNFGDGREFNSDDINKALRLGRPDCYTFLDYSVTSRSHGTRVLDIAAGSGTETNPPGVAPGADLIFVDLADVNEPEQPLGNSKYLLDAVNYIFTKADEIGKREGKPRSVVINVSLACDTGPHDASSPFERAIDHLVQTPGRAVVIAAGNSAGRLQDNNGNRTLERHAARLLQMRLPVPLKWQIGDGGPANNKVDAWYDGRHELVFSLISPSGVDVGCFPLNTTTTICRDGQTAARVFHRRLDPNNGDNEIVLIFTQRMEAGDWTIKLTSLSSLPFTVHAWADVTGGRRSGFPNESVRDVSHTINAIACSHNSIAVGGYFSAVPSKILPESSEGPTRDGRLKPEVSAPGATVPFDPDSDTPVLVPGRGIRAAAIETDFSERSTGGTSAAAPHVAGLIALLMQNAGEPLSITDIRNQVIKTARRLEGEVCGWHPRFGHGRIDASRALLSRTHFEPPSKTVNTESVSNVLGTGATINSPQKGDIAMPRRQRLTTPEGLVPLERLDRETLQRLSDGEEVDHTPIIITDGSVRIDLSSEEYTDIGGVEVSTGLNLHLIESTHATHRDGTGLCYFIRPNDLCMVIFHTTRDGAGDAPIVIQGGLGTSPTIIFDRAEYQRDMSAPSNRRVYVNAQRRLTQLEIIRIRDEIQERVHVCPLIDAGTNRRYKVWDPHRD